MKHPERRSLDSWMTSWGIVPILSLDPYLWISVSERLASASPWGLGEPQSNSAGVGKSQKHAFLISFQEILILIPQALRIAAWDYVSNCVDKRKIKVTLFKPLIFHSLCPQLKLPKWSGGKTCKSRLAWLGLMGEEILPGLYPGLAAAVCYEGSLPIT